MFNAIRFGMVLAVGLSLLGCGSTVVEPLSAPSISAVLPQTIAAGSSAVTMKVVGANFTSSAVILWNGAKLATTVVDSTTLSGSIQGSSIAVPGTAQLQVQNSQTGQSSQSVPVSIVQSATTADLPLAIATTTLSSGVVGTSYRATLAATGGTSPYSWSVTSGSLPAGLALSSSTGVISGTPSASGTSSFTVTVTDSSSPTQTASAALTIVTAPAPALPSALVLSAIAPGSGTVGTTYHQALQASGGTSPYTWSVASGSLPAGLTLSSSTGVISGTPTSKGTSNFTVRVTDSSSPEQTQSASSSISIAAATTPALTITSSTLLSGTTGTAYHQALQASGGTSPYTWSVASGSLPAGLSLSSSTGVISGTPTGSGTSSFTVRVTDSSSPVQTQSAATSITVAAAAEALTITSSTLPSGTANSGYSQNLEASGGTSPYTWSITSGSLPAGLTLASTGVISGTPTSSGTSSFTVKVTDSSSPVQTQSAAISIAIAAAPPAGPGTTWFVRTDGGSRYDAAVPTGQCNGTTDGPYPGTGVNQNCAFSSVQYLYTDGTYGNSTWVIAGGDTVVIRGCAALPGEQNSDSPHCRVGWVDSMGTGGLCQGVNAAWGCGIPPVPSGTASNPTKILGGCAYGVYSCNPVIGYPYTGNNLTQLYGGFAQPGVLYLTGSKYVTIEGIEITSHNGVCTRVGATAFPECSMTPPVGDFANWGIITTNTTSNITLQDVYIHGMTTQGIGGPIGGPFTLTRVSIDFNAFAGWNFDDGSATPDAAGSTITQSFVTMVGNGCLEQYPIANTQYPALACWDSNSGGFGDSWSGQNSELDSFTCDHCFVAYNTKDGAMGPHTLIKNLVVTNSEFYGNMGQQGKWGTTQNNTTLFQNNLFIGNCQRMTQQLPGAAQNFNITTGLTGSYLSNYCRAAGDLFDYFSDLNSSVHFHGNTFVGYNATLLNLGFVTVGQGATSPYDFSDNVFLGYTTTTSNYPYSGEAPGLFYLGEASVVIVSSYNAEFGTRNNDCDTFHTGTHILCSDPLLTNEPAQGSWPPETVFDNFNFYPSAGSPIIGAGTAFTGLSTDYYGVTRPDPPSIGAVEPATP